MEAGTTTRAKIVASLAPSTLAAFMGIDETPKIFVIFLAAFLA